jgi:uncharacterized protein (DUF362 family)
MHTPKRFFSGIKANKLSRREFLSLAWQAGGALLLAGCAPANPGKTFDPTLSTALPTPAAAIEPLAPEPTASPTPPQPTLPPIPTATQASPFKAGAAIGQVDSYETQALRAQLERMLDDLGGLSDLVKTGARVGIKANLTGGTWWDSPDKPPATEYFVTHPAVVGALCELLRDAGAKDLIVMDGLGDETSFEKWGYAEMAKPLGVKLVDLCKPDPEADFSRLPVPGQPLVYDFFFVNQAVQELDVFISVAKMKCHTTTGVTLSMKNLFGLAPISAYRLNESDTNRSAFHGEIAFDTRVPRVIVDLNKARPIQLALVDGVITAEAGAGPWDTKMSQVRPGLLVASKNPVAADAVCTALMGFNPEEPAGKSPFVGGDNHLELAREAGLGTNRLDEISIHGPAIAEARFPFKPAR